MYDLVKKVLFISLGIALIVSITFNVTGTFSTSRNNELIIEYRDTINKIELELEGATTRNARVTELNISVGEQLVASREYNREAKILIDGINTGLNEDIDTLEGIIAEIRSIREALELYFDTVGDL